MIRKKEGKMKTEEIFKKIIIEKDKVKLLLELEPEQISDIIEMFLRDELTDLQNRRGFMHLAKHQLKVSKRRGEKAFLIYIDVNNLKITNDKFGHDVGDKLIKTIARVFKNSFRESDIIGRLGGDEFAILTCSNGNETKENIKERIEKKIAEESLLNSMLPVSLSVSIGISTYDPGNPFSLESLIKEADELMYEDKKKKRKLK